MALTLNYKQINKQQRAQKAAGKYLIYRMYRLKFLWCIASAQWKIGMKEVQINGVKLISNKKNWKSNKERMKKTEKNNDQATLFDLQLKIAN